MVGGGVRLRLMREEEWPAWRARAAVGYVEQLEQLGGVARAKAEAKGAADMAALWPDGYATRGQHVFVAEAGGVEVGLLWLQAGAPQPPDRDAWVLDVKVHEAHRRRGLGRDIMRGAEAIARDLGHAGLALNVFRENAAAIALYESLGYTVTDRHESGQHMRKTL